jgi:hypothetical protein
MLLYCIIPYLHPHFGHMLDTTRMVMSEASFFVLFYFLLPLSEVFQADNTVRSWRRLSVGCHYQYFWE